MPCYEANAVCSYNHAKDSTPQCCHPHLRENFRNIVPAETNNEDCMRNRYPCSSCCNPLDQECLCKSGYSKDFKDSQPEKHLHCVAHSCPLGICCTDCKNNNCKNVKDIITAKDISETREGIICKPVRHEEINLDGIQTNKERSCCEKKTSWTEPRICRCDPSDPSGYMKRCACECGAALITEVPKEKLKKTVRFADEVLTYEDREKAFRNLQKEDVKHLCNCCKECAVIGEEQCIGKPVLVYELPEPKFEGTSVTQKDFCRQEMPPREIPPWHPNMKDRWRFLDVPSLSETTYQCDFKPPPVVYAERKPVYLAPIREKIDPCQKLAEEYCAWKKTSTGKKHTYHSTCDECDKDLHRVHLHECDVAHLPPQYQCHGDGHICQPSYHTTGKKFTLSEKGDPGNSRYWWKRTCCVPEMEKGENLADLPPDLMKPVCPPYTTSYKQDFKDPQRLQSDRLYSRNCTGCTRPQGEEQPNLLCTKNTGEPFMAQRVGIV